MDRIRKSIDNEVGIQRGYRSVPAAVAQNMLSTLGIAPEQIASPESLGRLSVTLSLSRSQ